MKRFNIFLILIAVVASVALASDLSNTFKLGNNAAGNKRFIFNRGSNSPEIRWNESASKLQFSNDGSTFNDINPPTMAAYSIKGNNTGSTAAALDLTVAQTKALLNSAPTIQKFTATGTTAGYLFYVSSSNATVGATYTNNSNTYTVLATISSGTMLYCSGASAPLASGTLTKSGGTGDSTITFSSKVPLAVYTTPAGALALKVTLVGAGGGGGGSGSSGETAGTAGGDTVFGSSLLVGKGGSGGGQNSAGVGGAGGTASLGTGPVGIAMPGGTGNIGISLGANSADSGLAVVVAGIGGAGASTPFAGGGAGGGNNHGGSDGIANSGGGGGGGGSNGRTASVDTGSGGGAGGYVSALITSPAASYYYAVGSGGTFGGAGTGGYTGGAGATGLILVEEFYQ